MSTTLKIKIAIDVLMTLCWLLTMPYKLTGNLVHEYAGMLLFSLFIIHTLLNWRWYAALTKGSYNKRRLLSTAVNLLLLVCVLAAFATVPIISRSVCTLFNSGLDKMARKPWQGVHKVFARAGFWLMLVHLLLHGQLLKNTFIRTKEKPQA